MSDETVIAALEALGGTGALQDIYRWVRENGDLSDYELQETQWEAFRYQHRIRASLSVMKKNGQVTQVGRGVYRLT